MNVNKVSRIIHQLFDILVLSNFGKNKKKSDQKSFVTFPGLNFDYDHST